MTVAFMMLTEFAPCNAAADDIISVVLEMRRNQCSRLPTID
jgi:hypothetical protein